MDENPKMDITISAPVAVKQEPVATPDAAAVPAEKVQSLEPTAPQAEKPAGTEDETQTATEALPEKELSPAELNRKQRNKERWKSMREASTAAVRRAESAEAELYRIKSAAPPDFSKFTDPQDELAERTAFKLGQRMAEEHENRAAYERREASQALSQAWEASVEEARAKIPDFDAVALSPTTKIHARAVPFLQDSEKGAEIAYWLGKNPQAAADLAQKFQSAPAQALIELGRIEARLTPPTAKTLSTAPKPAPTLGGGVSPLQFDAARGSVGDMAAQLRKAGVIR